MSFQRDDKFIRELSKYLRKEEVDRVVYSESLPEENTNINVRTGRVILGKKSVRPRRILSSGSLRNYKSVILKFGKFKAKYFGERDNPSNNNDNNNTVAPQDLKPIDIKVVEAYQNHMMTDHTIKYQTILTNVRILNKYIVVPLLQVEMGRPRLVGMATSAYNNKPQLTHEEVFLTLRYMWLHTKNRDHVHKAILIYYTGLRSMEASALTYRDILMAFSPNSLVLKVRKGKNCARRNILLFKGAPTDYFVNHLLPFLQTKLLKLVSKENNDGRKKSRPAALQKQYHEGQGDKYHVNDDDDDDEEEKKKKKKKEENNDDDDDDDEDHLPGEGRRRISIDDYLDLKIFDESSYQSCQKQFKIILGKLFGKGKVGDDRDDISDMDISDMDISEDINDRTEENGQGLENILKGAGLHSIRSDYSTRTVQLIYEKCKNFPLAMKIAGNLLGHRKVNHVFNHYLNLGYITREGDLTTDNTTQEQSRNLRSQKGRGGQGGQIGGGGEAKSSRDKINKNVLPPIFKRCKYGDTVREVLGNKRKSHSNLRNLIDIEERLYVIPDENESIKENRIESQYPYPTNPSEENGTNQQLGVSGLDTNAVSDAFFANELHYI